MIDLQLKTLLDEVCIAVEMLLVENADTLSVETSGAAEAVVWVNVGDEADGADVIDVINDVSEVSVVPEDVALACGPDSVLSIVL